MTENELFKLYETLNTKYFQGSIFVAQIKFGRFLTDAIQGGVTFGQFRYDDKQDLNQIILNSYMVMPEIEAKYPWISEVVLYHELCHAHLVINKFPQRFGKYSCEMHGADFWELMLKHPLCKKLEVAQQKVFDLMKSKFDHDANQYLLKHPKKARKLANMYLKQRNQGGP